MLLCSNALHTRSTIYFTPDDKPLRPLTTLLRNAEKHILVCVYQFSHRALAQHLCAAQKRGCKVEVIVDSSTLEMKNHVVDILRNATVPVFVYHAPQGNHLCHHKYAVIDNETWTGSLNWTYRGFKNNQENAVHCDEKPIAQRYAQQFALLKKRCERLVPLRNTAGLTSEKGMWERLRGAVARLLR
jgi:phosphatidylserine/phosphatidylglycerophosphate/cardiolipin synthase-like enzyme